MLLLSQRRAPLHLPSQLRSSIDSRRFSNSCKYCDLMSLRDFHIDPLPSPVSVQNKVGKELLHLTLILAILIQALQILILVMDQCLIPVLYLGHVLLLRVHILTAVPVPVPVLAPPSVVGMVTGPRNIGAVTGMRKHDTKSPERK